MKLIYKDKIIYLYVLVTQLYLTLCNPTDYTLAGSSICGIFQAGVLEWGAIAFSRVYPRCVIFGPQCRSLKCH